MTMFSATSRLIARRLSLLFIALGFALPMLAGCSTTEHANYNRPMPPDKLAQVSLGMEQQDLRQILGSPTLVDGFHPNLLVYLFVDPKTAAPWQALITLTADGKVAKIDHRSVQNAQ